MDRLYEYMKQKLDEMHTKKATEIVVDYDEFAKLYQLICYMKQIRTIVNS